MVRFLGFVIWRQEARRWTRKQRLEKVNGTPDGSRYCTWFVVHSVCTVYSRVSLIPSKNNSVCYGISKLNSRGIGKFRKIPPKFRRNSGGHSSVLLTVFRIPVANLLYSYRGTKQVVPSPIHYKLI